jgi:tetratricopeptide (TPR) repeat protein
MAGPTIQQTLDLALQHHRARRLHEAEQLYRQILTQHPDHAVAMHHLGLIAHQTGRNDIAAELIRRAIVLSPGRPEAHYDLGIVLKDAGQLDEATAAFRQSIALNPNIPEAHFNLGITLQDKGQLDEAMAAFRQAIVLRAHYAEAHGNLGNVLRDKEQLDEAITAYRQAVVINPNLSEAHSNLGIALRDKGQLDEAIAACRNAITLRPDFAKAYGNLANALKEKGHFEEAIAAYRHAIALNPNSPETHYNLSFAMLARGDFQPGWEEYEWRWKCKNFPSPRQNFAQPNWDGNPLDGRTILLHTEQGLGDAIQFIRYVPLVAQRGRRIIIQCQEELHRLFQTMAEKVQVVAHGQPLPAFDFHSPLLSLPRIFETTLSNVPQIVPYLKADADDAKTWQRRIGDDSQIINVGLAWAGSSAHKNDRNRSIKLASLSPLVQTPGVRFFSLQKGDAAAESKTPPTDMELIDWTNELNDFADTAALIANLDLVIAVDTAVAHLAGAMGKPIWTLLPFVPDWRWLLHREDSPWYPSMRLFRQPSLGDWNSVVTRVAETLSHWIKNRA